MLILGRNVGESIMIGDDVKVTVTRLDNGNVKLGVTSPKDISVHREEVYDRINREKLETAND
ncbi:MAG: putative regulator [Prokaryotic dsDNA virus sp.]|uniref:carbon storage regulator CsrA n=1 Tax=Gammaproteobacteria TaxID=1236 RepID=UPI000C630415|nr:MULTISPECIES: carbon storage regulator CsrA [Gammaproteobacteria]MBP58945.1 carbon storage regulator [Idiomarina sp.]QDP60892.1 MAG: putative regulator [Prokaryotic dsDNA virus sp.]QDP61773.1 MAG: putative regulator [Prokaryotic dsDNA virus sp.]HCC80421.1 carbon storage regulator [Methylophaga sp.]|tara:strand:+ start:3713 stop:3898 length:186 start_codon:yes stop_codon:yes gene_type:complete